MKNGRVFWENKIDLAFTSMTLKEKEFEIWSPTTIQFLFFSFFTHSLSFPVCANYSHNTEEGREEGRKGGRVWLFLSRQNSSRFHLFNHVWSPTFRRFTRRFCFRRPEFMAFRRPRLLPSSPPHSLITRQRIYFNFVDSCCCCCCSCC